MALEERSLVWLDINQERKESLRIESLGPTGGNATDIEDSYKYPGIPGEREA